MTDIVAKLKQEFPWANSDILELALQGPARILPIIHIRVNEDRELTYCPSDTDLKLMGRSLITGVQDALLALEITVGADDRALVEAALSDLANEEESTRDKIGVITCAIMQYVHMDVVLVVGDLTIRGPDAVDYDIRALNVAGKNLHIA